MRNKLIFRWIFVILIILMSMMIFGFKSPDVVNDGCIDTKDLALVSQCYESSFSGICFSTDVDEDNYIGKNDYYIVNVLYQYGINQEQVGDCQGYSCQAEVCDANDNDCDGLFDEDFDKDQDSFTTCGYHIQNGDFIGVDCNDNDSSIKPSANELCDGIDNNCNNQIDEGFLNNDNDALADCVDDDDDNDGILDANDNCVLIVNPGQKDFDNNGVGDRCDQDSDGDGVLNQNDQCLATPRGSIVDQTGCPFLGEVEKLFNLTLPELDKLNGAGCSSDEECEGGYCVEGKCSSLAAVCGDGVCSADETCSEDNCCGGNSVEEGKVCCNGFVYESCELDMEFNLDFSPGEVKDNVNLFTGKLDIDYEIFNLKGSNDLNTSFSIKYHSGFDSEYGALGKRWNVNLNYILKTDNEFVMVVEGKSHKLISIGEKRYVTEKNNGWELTWTTPERWTAISPEGVEYRFEWNVYRNGKRYMWNLGRVEDLFGNSITYSYLKEKYFIEGKNLNINYLSKISDSYGREIIFDYEQSKIHKLGDSYLKRLNLITVHNPDNSVDKIYKLKYFDYFEDYVLTSIRQYDPLMSESLLLNLFTYGFDRKLTSIWNEAGGVTKFEYEGEVISKVVKENNKENVFTTSYSFVNPFSYDFYSGFEKTFIEYPEDAGVDEYVFFTNFPFDGLINKKISKSNIGEAVKSETYVWTDVPVSASIESGDEITENFVKFFKGIGDKITGAFFSSSSYSRPSPATEYNCTDSDSGLDYNTIGKIVYTIPGQYPITKKDVCWDRVVSDNQNFTSKQLREGYCDGANVTYQIYDCPNGCENGKCLTQEEYVNTKTKCSESDGGKNYFKLGYLNYTGPDGYEPPSWATLIPFDKKDRCIGKQSDVLMPQLEEYYCDDTYYAMEVYDCPNGCYEGACVSDNMLDQLKCVDSDGKNFTSKGVVEWIDFFGNTIEFTDACWKDAKTVTEWYCENNMFKSTSQLCPCKDGACIKVSLRLAHKEIKEKDSKLEVDYDYDSFGNEILIIEKSGDFERTTIKRYISGTDLIKTKITKGSKGNTYREFFEWDASKRKLTRKGVFVNGKKRKYESYKYGRRGNLIEISPQEVYPTVYRKNAFDEIVEEKQGDLILSKKTYYPNGKIKSDKDKEGVKVFYTYDDFGRVISVGSKDDPEIQFGYVPGKKVTIVDLGPGRQSITYETFDGFGNLIKIEVNKGGGYKIVQDFRYDSFGNLISISEKYRVRENEEYSPEHFQTYDYSNDPLRNIKRIGELDNSFTVYDYREEGILSNENGKKFSLETYDGFGNLVNLKVSENGTVDEISYEYDSMGNTLKKITDEKTINLVYDAFQNLKSADGNSYEYDLAGNLLKEIDIVGNTNEYEYTKFGLLAKKKINDVVVEKYTYDDKQKLDILKVNDKDNADQGIVHFKYIYDNNSQFLKINLLDENKNPLLKGESYNPYLWDYINIPVSIEVCDGEDNDLDGLVDMKVSGAPLCEKQLGVCFGWTQECNSQEGSWGECDYSFIENYEESESKCDGLDNDCDGAVDEGCVCNLGDVKICGIDRGLCMKGEQVCVEGEWPEECLGVVAPSMEICDNLDNDCDGEVDENVKNACGSCGDVPFEVCDNLDNDCDGEVDEGFENVPGCFNRAYQGGLVS